MPARVPAEVKELVLKTVDDAVAAGFSHTGRARCGRFQTRGYTAGGLAAVTPAPWSTVRRAGTRCTRCCPGDHRDPDIAERWGAVDRSHRKLAHRGSYEQLVWVSPSTFRRVLIDQGLSLPEPQPRSRSAKKPWPDWLEWKPNRIWIWDATFHAIPPGLLRDRGHGVSQVDRHLVSVEETATQVQVMFEHALEVEGLLELLTDERLDLDTDDPRRPILLAVSDNGPPMTARDTRAFAWPLMAIAQHHGRPHTPQDQAWIETFFGHIKWASGRIWRPSPTQPCSTPN